MQPRGSAVVKDCLRVEARDGRTERGRERGKEGESGRRGGGDGDGWTEVTVRYSSCTSC